MKTVLVLSLVAATCLAYLPQSFRHQSTAGVLWDDYDFLHDPALMLDIQGSRVYTSLSNYVTGNDAQFGSNRSNFFLLGGNSRFGAGPATAVIFDRYKFDQPLFTGLFSPDSLDSLFGSARSTYAEWRDPDSNGTYDYKRVSQTERNAWRRGASTDFFLGSGLFLAFARFRLGAALAWNREGIEFTDPDSDYVMHSFDSSLVSGRLTWAKDDTGRFRRSAGNDAKTLALSGWYDVRESLAAELSLAPGLIARSSSRHWATRRLTDYNPGLTEPKDFESFVADDVEGMPYSGLSLPLTLRLIARSEESETWWHVGTLLRSEKLGTGAQASHVGCYRHTLNPGDSSVADSTRHSYRGATSNTSLNAGMRRVQHLTDRLDLGFALNLNAGFFADSVFDTMGQVQVVTYDNGDSLQTIDDYVQTTTAAESWLRRKTGCYTALALPVGLEFRVIPSVALRLGALPILRWDDVTTTNQLLTWHPRKVRTVYGDGSFSERIDDEERSPASSETRRSFVQTTELSYGAGFRPVENLQIDLMGFANLTNLVNWRLSATLRF